MGQIQRMGDLSEIVPYQEQGIPLYIGVGHLMKARDWDRLCHWHEEIEVTRILDGGMTFQEGSRLFNLQKGDIIFTNSRQLHANRLQNTEFCVYQCLLFHTNLLTENPLLVQRYVEPVVGNKDLPYLYLPASAPENAGAAAVLDGIFSAYESKTDGYEMDVIGYLHLLWNRIRPMCAAVNKRELKTYTDETLQKDMVSFIYQHFTEHLTLADIAAAGNVCQNKCCAIFRRYTKQSPVDFLNSYRLQVSRNMLDNTEKSITEIATACGFNHLSYFSKMFQRKYGVTPSAYRVGARRTAATRSRY